MLLKQVKGHTAAFLKQLPVRTNQLPVYAYKGLSQGWSVNGRQSAVVMRQGFNLPIQCLQYLAGGPVAAIRIDVSLS